MKKLIMICLIAICLILPGIANASGGQHQGDKGKGSVNQVQISK